MCHKNGSAGVVLLPMRFGVTAAAIRRFPRMITRSGWHWARVLMALVALPVTALSVSAQNVLTLNGAGASFPYPLYSKAFDEYNKIHPEVRVNYQSVGSGAGIQQLTQKTVDFGASDAPMTDEQLQAAGG